MCDVSWKDRRTRSIFYLDCCRRQGRSCLYKWPTIDCWQSPLHHSSVKGEETIWEKHLIFTAWSGLSELFNYYIDPLYCQYLLSKFILLNVVTTRYIRFVCMSCNLYSHLWGNRLTRKDSNTWFVKYFISCFRWIHSFCFFRGIYLKGERGGVLKFVWKVNLSDVLRFFKKKTNLPDVSD